MGFLTKVSKNLKSLKILNYGPSASGKTYGSLLLAKGIVMAIRNCKPEEAFEHIALIDSEYGRGSLYSDFGPYNYVRIDAPYSTDKLIQIFAEIENEPNIDVIIVDSLTPFWSKKGGILDQKAQRDKLGGNSYTNWQEYTGKFNDCLDLILSSNKHVIVTTRAKTDVALIVNETGKTTPKTFGLTPEIRDGIEYEFDIVFNIDKDTHSVITEKGIRGMDAVYDPITEELGKAIYSISTANATKPIETKEATILDIRNLSVTFNKIMYVQGQLNLIKPGTNLDSLELDALIKIKNNLMKEIRKDQINKNKAK